MKHFVHSIAALVAATVTLTGCSGSSTTEEPGKPVIDRPITFTPGRATVQAPSRAATFSPLEESFENFGVMGWKTDGDGNEHIVFMHSDATPYAVLWNAPMSVWHYDVTTDDGYEQYLKYWDLSSTSYRFVATAPYRGLAIIDPVTGEVHIPGVRGNIYPANGIDWAVAYKTVTLTPGVDPEPVPLEFHRLMSGIEVRVFLQNPGETLVSGLDVNFENGAAIDILADYDEGVWTPASPSVSTVCSLSGLNASVTGTSRETSTQLLKFVELPQSVVGNDITFRVTLSSGRTVEGTFTLAEGWEAEKLYIYYLKLNVADAYIFMDVDVESLDWTQGDNIDINDPVINW